MVLNDEQDEEDYEDEDDQMDDEPESESEPEPEPGRSQHEPQHPEPSGTYLKEKTSMLSQLDDVNINQYFAVYYNTPCTYYWGQLCKVFSFDDDSKA